MEQSPCVGVLDRPWLEAATAPVDVITVDGGAAVVVVLEAAAVAALVGVVEDAGGASCDLTFLPRNCLGMA